MKKIYTIISLFGIVASPLSNAETKSVLISAKFQAGCVMSASDIAFGDITFTKEKSETVDTNFRIACSKGTKVTLGARSKNNPLGYTGQWMTRNGEQVVQDKNMKDPAVGIQYAIRTNNIISNPEYTITQRPTYNWLNSYKSTNDHYMKLTFLTDKINILSLFHNRNKISICYFTSFIFLTYLNYIDYKLL